MNAAHIFFQSFLRPKMLIMFILHFDSFWMKNNNNCFSKFRALISVSNIDINSKCCVCVWMPRLEIMIYGYWHIASTTEMQLLFASSDHFPVSEKGNRKYSHGNKANERKRKCVQQFSFGIEFQSSKCVIYEEIRFSNRQTNRMSHLHFWILIFRMTKFRFVVRLNNQFISIKPMNRKWLAKKLQKKIISWNYT